MSVTFPTGFAAAGVSAGLKESGAKDLAIVHNLGPEFVAAGVFTRNRVCAAPVQWSKTALADASLRAVVLNSGGANACTGASGYDDAVAMAQAVADELNVPAPDVAVCSTGLIGERLNMAAVRRGISAAADGLNRDGGEAAAQAIMTTDTVPKLAAVEGHGWRIGGMAKGAGMLAPALATMLVVITTDARVQPELASAMLKEACRLTFNRADGDGCMSTNDTVLLLANGASGVDADPQQFQTALTALCQDLALQLLADAEGAAHQVAIRVVRAASERDAEVVAREVARSNLFKCAVFGNDPNWGRVLAAVGVTDAEFNPDELSVSFNGVEVCRNGGIGEPRESVDMSGRQLDVVIDLNAGDAEATVWTTDLTHEYVSINADYSS